MEILIILFFIVLIVLIIFNIKKLGFKSKSPIVKKSEIIQSYKETLDALETKEEKIAELKRINQELARNIFFDQDEMHGVMSDLTKHAI